MKFPSPDRTYPGKLLLFGEYTVLSGSRALAIPLTRWQGRLRSGSTQDEHLMGLSTFLETHGLFDKISRRAFLNAVQDGLTFDSNIPQGYGVGSSGALCAAVYEQFLASAESIGDVARGHAEMAQMEGYFHGRSSGMDPLVSLNSLPVLKELGQYHLLPPLIWPEDLRVFLLDTGVGRKTGHLVETYLKISAQEAFQQSCIRPLVQHVDHAISFLIDFHLSAFWQHLQIISQLQFQYFTPMIPPVVLELWGQTLAKNKVCMKLCGAGGGGFFLGFAPTETDFIEFKNTCPLEIIPLH